MYSSSSRCVLRMLLLRLVFYVVVLHVFVVLFFLRIEDADAFTSAPRVPTPLTLLSILGLRLTVLVPVMSSV